MLSYTDETFPAISFPIKSAKFTVARSISAEFTAKPSQGTGQLAGFALQLPVIGFVRRQSEG